MVNLPYLLNAPLNTVLPGALGDYKCQRNTHFTNYPSSQFQNISGSVIFGPAVGADGLLKSGPFLEKSPQPGGLYPDASGFMACTQIVGYEPFGYEYCEEAAAKVDPASLT
jgi:hypothetical protein